VSRSVTIAADVTAGLRKERVQTFLGGVEGKTASEQFGAMGTPPSEASATRPCFGTPPRELGWA